MGIKWVELARQYIGLQEIKGSANHPEIVQFWKDIKRGGIKDDETPWCAAFVGAMLERSGIESSRYESAGSYKNWGTQLGSPVYGCVAVFDRKGGGHVGFVVGVDERGRIMVLGGNQSDGVNIKPFEESRVTSYRWPHGVELPHGQLPVIKTTAKSSTNEQ